MRSGKRYQRPRPTVATADNNTVVDRTTPSPLTSRRRRWPGCHPFTADTVRPAVSAAAPAGRSPLSPRSVRRSRCHGCCFILAGDTVRQQAVPANAAAVARAAAFSSSVIRLGSKRYQRPPPRRPVFGTATNSCSPLTSLPAPWLSPPLPRLSLLAAADTVTPVMPQTTAPTTAGRRYRQQQPFSRRLPASMGADSME